MVPEPEKLEREPPEAVISEEKKSDEDSESVKERVAF